MGKSQSSGEWNNTEEAFQMQTALGRIVKDINKWYNLTYLTNYKAGDILSDEATAVLNCALELNRNK